MELRNIKVLYDNGESTKSIFGQKTRYFLGATFEHNVNGSWKRRTVSFVDMLRSQFTYDVMENILDDTILPFGFNVNWNKAPDSAKVLAVVKDFEGNIVDNNKIECCNICHFGILSLNASEVSDKYTVEFAPFSLTELFTMYNSGTEFDPNSVDSIIARYFEVVGHMLKDTLSLKLIRADRMFNTVEFYCNQINSKVAGATKDYVNACNFDRLFRSNQFVVTMADVNRYPEIFTSGLSFMVNASKMCNDILNRVGIQMDPAASLKEKRLAVLGSPFMANSNSCNTAEDVFASVMLVSDATLPYNKELVDQFKMTLGDNTVPIMQVFDNSNPEHVMLLGANVSEITIPDYISIVNDHYESKEIRHNSNQSTNQGFSSTSEFVDAKEDNSSIIKVDDGKVIIDLDKMVNHILEDDKINQVKEMWYDLSFDFVNKYEVSGDFFFISSTYSDHLKNDKVNLDAIRPHNLKVYPEAKYQKTGGYNSHSFLASSELSGRSLSSDNKFNGYSANNKLSLGLREKEWIHRFKSTIDACICFEKEELQFDLEAITCGITKEGTSPYILRPHSMTNLLFRDLLEPISVMTRGFSGRVTLRMENFDRDSDEMEIASVGYNRGYDPNSPKFKYAENHLKIYGNYPDIPENEGGNVLINMFRPSLSDMVSMEVGEVADVTGMEVLNRDVVSKNFYSRFSLYFNNNVIGTYSVPEVIVRLLRSGEYLKPQVLSMEGSQNDINLNTLEIAKGLGFIRKDRYSHVYEIVSVLYAGLDYAKSYSPDGSEEFKYNLYGTKIRGPIPVGVVIKSKHFDIPNAYNSYVMSFKALNHFMRSKTSMKLGSETVSVYPVVSGMSYSPVTDRVEPFDTNDFGWVKVDFGSTHDIHIKTSLQEVYLRWSKLPQVNVAAVREEVLQGNFNNLNDRACMKSELFDTLKSNYNGEYYGIYGINPDFTYHRQPKFNFLKLIDSDVDRLKTLEGSVGGTEDRAIYAPEFDNKMKVYQEFMKTNKGLFKDSTLAFVKQVPKVFDGSRSELSYLIGALNGTETLDEMSEGSVKKRIKNGVLNSKNIMTVCNSIESGTRIEIKEEFLRSIQPFTNETLCNLEDIFTSVDSIIIFMNNTPFDYDDLEISGGTGVCYSAPKLTIESLMKYVKGKPVIDGNHMISMPKADNRLWYIIEGSLQGKSTPFAAIYLDSDGSLENPHGTKGIVEAGIIPLMTFSGMSEEDKAKVKVARQAIGLIITKSPSVKGNHKFTNRLKPEAVIKVIYKTLLTNSNQIFDGINPSDDLKIVIKKMLSTSVPFRLSDNVRLLTENSARDFLQLVYSAI